jgi:hypothetical protein
MNNAKFDEKNDEKFDETLQLDYDLESPKSDTQLTQPLTTNKKSYKKYIFRFLLLISLVSVILPYIPPLHLSFLKTPYYIIPLSMFASFISFQVIPLLTTYIHKKELQLKDLIDKEMTMRRVPSDPEIKLLNDPIYHIKLYKYLLYTFSSIFMGVLVYYLLFDLEHTSLNYIEITGILITYVNFFNSIHQNVSRGVLMVLHYYKNYNKDKNHINIEINNNNYSKDIETLNQSTYN